MSDSSTTFGFHAVDALLARRPGKVERIIYLDQRRDNRINGLLHRAKSARIECLGVGKTEFSKMFGESEAGLAQQAIAAVLKPDRISNEADLDKLLEQTNQHSLYLILDNITDPHNLGACLRSANAAGVAAVILPKDRAAPLNSIARKVACGAAGVTPVIRVTNLARILKHMQACGIIIVGTAGEAVGSVYDIDLRGPLALVMGSEDKGLRRLTRDNCDVLVKIPLQGEVGSLNVSVATGICLFEALRQRA